MTGRWLMQSIQMTFAIMPALDLLVRRLRRAQLGRHGLLCGRRDARRLHDPPDPPVRADREPALDLGRRPELARALRPDLRVPRPAGRHRAGQADARERARRRRGSRTSGSATATGPTRSKPSRSRSRPGTTTAIVGETGAGKTTLGYLVSRLYDPTKGRVTIDGVDIRELTFESLAATVGVVSQETYLFHATMRENLRFAKPDATDEEVEEAARAAQIHELISSLPEGYETVVGERGYRFSGGEKQRIAIARAILRNPPILVLDEATSALDTQTERAVQEALARLVEGRTTIAIAHRLSTVRDADQIVVLDGGRVAETGTYDELVARGGRFAALAARDSDSFDAPPSSPSSPSDLSIFASCRSGCPCRSPTASSSGPDRPPGRRDGDDESPPPHASPATVKWALQRAVVRSLAILQVTVVHLEPGFALGVVRLHRGLQLRREALRGGDCEHGRRRRRGQHEIFLPDLISVQLWVVVDHVSFPPTSWRTALSL